MGFDPVSYLMGKQAGGGGAVLQEGNVNIRFEGEAKYTYTPSSGFDGFSDFTVSVSPSPAVKILNVMTATTFNSMIDFVDDLMEAIKDNTSCYGNVVFTLGNNIFSVPVKVSRSGQSFFITGGFIAANGSGPITLIEVNENSAVCHYLYSISSGTLTDISSYAPAIVNISLVIYL